MIEIQPNVISKSPLSFSAENDKYLKDLGT